ncbi:MAG: hypothetical protein ABIY55_12205, partial [Kofleriaceae bacterium]
MNTPATYAAVSSPMLCPSITSGSTPHDCHSAASAISTANTAGCVYAVWLSACSVPSHITLRSGRSRWRSSASIAASSAARNTGHVAASSRPIPTTCEPWPLNSHAVLPRWTLPRALPAGRSPRATASSAARSVSRFSTTSVTRCSWWLRLVARLYATSPSACSGCASRCCARRAAFPSTAAALRPEIAISSTPRGSASRVGATAGASSITTCALVPLTPNELTPAIRRTPLRDHATSLATTVTGSSSHAMCGFGVPTWMLRGIRSCASASTTF